MSPKEKLIIKYIIMAQLANNEAHEASRWGRYAKASFYYKKKEVNYKKALSLLKSLRHTKISYLQKQEPDQNGYPSTIRYFEWREPALGGKKVQFSFHSPREKGALEGDRKIQWTGLLGECSALAEKLKKYYL